MRVLQTLGLYLSVVRGERLSTGHGPRPRRPGVRARQRGWTNRGEAITRDSK